MHIGNLVKIQRASIGVPKGTIGLIVTTRVSGYNAKGSPCCIYEIELCGIKKRQGGYRQYLERDLELIS